MPRAIGSPREFVDLKCLYAPRVLAGSTTFVLDAPIDLQPYDWFVVRQMIGDEGLRPHAMTLKTGPTASGPFAAIPGGVQAFSVPNIDAITSFEFRVASVGNRWLSYEMATGGSTAITTACYFLGFRNARNAVADGLNVTDLAVIGVS